MDRGFDFLKHKYYEVFLPNIFVQLSDKLGTVLDVIVVGFLIGSLQLSSLNAISPFVLISAIIYSLYGQGGSILAIKAKSDLDSEKANEFFTLSIVGCVLSSLMYMLLILIFADPLLHILNIPESIFEASKTYLLIITNFFTLNTYIKVLAYFLKSDGRAKLTLYSVLIANILNLVLDFLLFYLLGQNIASIAWALVIGYLVSAIYISKYYVEKDANFKLVSFTRITFKKLNQFSRAALHATPELIGRVLLAIKTTVLVYLCVTYLGPAGLLAFLAYDNVETLVYLFVSGVIKTASPFITLFYNEQDYPSVEYMTKLSTKHILIFIIALSTLFVIYPEILLVLLNITGINEQMIVSLAVRITSIGLIGRCVSMIIADYAQSISASRISAMINFLREGILPFAFMLIFIPLFGGVGIWFTLSLSDIIPVFVYLAIVFYQKKKYSTLKNSALMIPESISFHWTGIRGNFEEMNEDMQESNKKIIENIKYVFDNDYLIITGTLEDIAKNIFTVDKTMSEIDISIIINNGFVVLRFIYDGDPYNPFENSELLKNYNIKKLNKFNHDFDYHSMFDMNFTYVKIFND